MSLKTNYKIGFYQGMAYAIRVRDINPEVRPICRLRRWFSREGGNDPGSPWTVGLGLFFRGLLEKGTGVHWGSWGLPTRERECGQY